jgi:hypothetical protein
MFAEADRLSLDMTAVSLCRYGRSDAHRRDPKSHSRTSTYVNSIRPSALARKRGRLGGGPTVGPSWWRANQPQGRLRLKPAMKKQQANTIENFGDPAQGRSLLEPSGGAAMGSNFHIPAAQQTTAPRRRSGPSSLGRVVPEEDLPRSPPGKCIVGVLAFKAKVLL